MLRRISASFNRKAKKDEGHTNGFTPTQKPQAQHQASSSAAHKQEKESEDHSASRKAVESSFDQFAQLIHTSRRPLPTQTGDGSYIDHEVPSSLFQDLKSLGFKDVNTLIQVIKTKAGGGLQDDSTYLMEHVIQVSIAIPKAPVSSLI